MNQNTPVSGGNADRYNSPVYRRSRSAYKAQCTFDYFICLLISDAYLAKLLGDIGISDTIIGIISSIATAAILFQLNSLLLVRKIKNTKRVAVICNSLSQLFFVLLYLIPFLPLSVSAKTALVCICLLLGYLIQGSVSTIVFKWANSFVDPAQRASYSAGKEIISLISGMVFTLIVGQMLDKMESLDRLHTGFLIIAAAGFILSICNFISLMLIGKDDTEEETNTVPMKKVIRETLGNRSFLGVIVLSCLWSMACGMTVGFMGTFKTKDLLLSVGTVQIINIAANLVRVIVSKPIGRFSDRTSYARGFELALCIAGAAFAVNIFSSPNAVFCVVLHTILYNVSIAGTNQNSNNIVYSYVPKSYFVQAMAIKNCICGVIGFLSSLAAARLLSLVQDNGNMLFGIPMYGQQLLSAVSFVLVLADILFIHFVIAPKSIMKQ